MNIKNIIILNLVLICILFINLNAELLILKQTASGFEPLSQADIDKDGDAISKIILKYQWPMCIISKLNKEEQEELGSSLPNAEEIFIEKKLRKISDSYRVVFMPTTIYELFFILYYIQNFNVNDPIKNVYRLIKEIRPNLQFEDEKLVDLINKPKFGKINFSKLRFINRIYRKFNNLFFDLSYLNSQEVSEMESFNLTPYMFLNQKIVKFLLDDSQIQLLKESENSLIFSNKINNYIDLILDYIKRSINDVSLYNSLPANRFVDVSEMLYLIMNYDGSIKIISSLRRMIYLEYEARKLNRGILVRASSPLEVDIEIESEKDTKEADVISPPKATLFQRFVSKITTVVTTIYRRFSSYSKEQLPYSISFGNSMFAGILEDVGACTYSYLLPNYEKLVDTIFSSSDLFEELSSSTVSFSSEDHDKIDKQNFGYAVFIDKRNYFMHKIFNLFYLSPLSTIAGVFAKGEFFHSRTKVPIAEKSDKEFIHVVGISTKLKNNIDRIIFIYRDPLEHERLFSSYLSKNGKIIQIGTLKSDLIPMEISIEEHEEEFKRSLELLKKSAATKLVQTENFKKLHLPILVRKAFERFKEKIKNGKPASENEANKRKLLDEDEGDLQKRLRGTLD